MALVSVPTHAADAPDTCNAAGWAGNCTTSNDGSQIDITGSLTLPGHPGGTSLVPDDDRRPGTPPPTPEPEPEPECLLGRCQVLYDVVALPDVTIDDLASFRPAAPSLTGEPDGFGVAGMPTNIVAAASEQRIAGVLFDYEVVVRFVPTAYVFDFGDGGELRSATGGATWERLGQVQFTSTATSHTFYERGSYPVRVTVEYAASVDFGSGQWRPVPGVVSATAGGYEVRVVEVRTALVARSCLEDPAGPGC